LGYFCSKPFRRIWQNEAEKIASTVNAVKTAEPEQIDVPLLSKLVINAKFQDNLI
jgi:hypothetical protein